MLQPYRAHSCSHVPNRSGCSGWAVTCEPLWLGTAGSSLAGAWQANGNCDRQPQPSIQPWTSISSTEDWGCLGFVVFLGFIELRVPKLLGVKITSPVKIFWQPCQLKEAGALPSPCHPGAASCQPPCLCSCPLGRGVRLQGWVCWHGWPGWHAWLWPHGQPDRVMQGGKERWDGGRGSPASGKPLAQKIYQNTAKWARHPTVILMSFKKKDLRACLSWLHRWMGRVVPLRIPCTTGNKQVWSWHLLCVLWISLFRCSYCALSSGFTWSQVNFPSSDMLSACSYL